MEMNSIRIDIRIVLRLQMLQTTGTHPTRMAVVTPLHPQPYTAIKAQPRSSTASLASTRTGARICLANLAHDRSGSDTDRRRRTPRSASVSRSTHPTSAKVSSATATAAAADGTHRPPRVRIRMVRRCRHRRRRSNGRTSRTVVPIIATAAMIMVRRQPQSFKDGIDRTAPGHTVAMVAPTIVPPSSTHTSEITGGRRTALSNHARRCGTAGGRFE